MARIKIWAIRCDDCSAIILADVHYRWGQKDLCRECYERAVREAQRGQVVEIESNQKDTAEAWLVFCGQLRTANAITVSGVFDQQGTCEVEGCGHLAVSTFLDVERVQDGSEWKSYRPLGKPHRFCEEHDRAHKLIGDA